MIPWLSVIVPVHDGARFLGATLESAAAERPQGVEFLVYDSGDDGGAARRVADAYADRLDLRWTPVPEIKPWTAKTNLGVREARTDHVCMLHQDDLWLPGHLDAVRRMIMCCPESVSIGPSCFANADGGLVGKWKLPFGPGTIAKDRFLEALLVQNSIAVPSPVIPRKAWLAVGGMDEDLWYTADWDLYLKLAGVAAIQVRPAITTAFRLHGRSLTMMGRRDALQFRAQLETVLNRHVNALPAALRKGAERLARVSIDVNCSLAAASAGQTRRALDGLAAMLRLGPRALILYLCRSRIIDRLLPRVRLSLAGRF